MGVSGIFSIFSGYFIAAQVFKKPSQLTRIWSYFLVALNVWSFVADYWTGMKANIAHLKAHFANTVLGFVSGWIILTKVGVKVYNL